MGAPAKSFEDLVVWQRAHAFTLAVYEATQKFPREEIYGLTSQFRRAAVSVPANIAEGFEKRGKADKAKFMNTAQGSLAECRYYLILSRDLDYLKPDQLFMLEAEVRDLLDKYHAAIANSAQPNRWLSLSGFLHFLGL